MHVSSGNNIDNLVILCDMQKWVGEMAPYVKSLDPNHLLTLGEEGFYSTSTRRLDSNPGADSERRTMQHFKFTFDIFHEVQQCT